MNRDILKGQWKEMSGSVKAAWGKLTDDDLQEIDGDTERLAGTLQKRYGYARDEAEKKVREFMDRRH